jgi:hypothetical protein
MANDATRQLAEARRQVSQHDRILPRQDLGPMPRERAPEELLMIAVLNDALECLEKHRFATERQECRLFREARRWFLADDTQWPYSFERICGALDLDANRILRRIAIRAAAQRTSRSLHFLTAI